MKMRAINFSFFIFYITFGLINTFAQSTRELINNGVDLYNEQKFADAEVNFKKGNEKSPDNFEAKFNLGDAYYKQQRYDEAMKSFQSAFVDAKDDLEKSKLYYNVGNSLLKSQKVKESIGAYKEALKLNPDDQQAKYNLSYALNQLKNPNQDQNQNNDKNKDQKDQNKDQQNKDQQNQDQQNKDQQNQDQEKQDQQQQQQQSKEQKQQELTKQEAEKILNALKENEKDLQKQLRKVKGQPIKTEKDW
jgi:Ca-activated chloride channel family protein